MTKAKVRWFDSAKGFGFLLLDDGREAFVHYSEIQSDGFRTLESDRLVSFDLYESEKGLIAKNVVQL